jgi:hypothetical protein
MRRGLLSAARCSSFKNSATRLQLIPGQPVQPGAHLDCEAARSSPSSAASSASRSRSGLVRLAREAAHHHGVERRAHLVAGYLLGGVTTS